MKTLCDDAGVIYRSHGATSLTTFTLFWGSFFPFGKQRKLSGSNSYTSLILCEKNNLLRHNNAEFSVNLLSACFCLCVASHTGSARGVQTSQIENKYGLLTEFRANSKMCYCLGSKYIVRSGLLPRHFTSLPSDVLYMHSETCGSNCQEVTSSKQ